MERSMKNYENEEQYLLHLIRSVMNFRKPDTMPGNLSVERLYKIASFHQVESIAYYGLEKTGMIIEKWEDIRDQGIMKSITQQTELDNISKALISAKIRHITLKGSNLRYLYPQLNYRSMSDLDILIDSENAEQVRNILEEMDYTTISFGEHIHDVYQKEPFMNVEIHRKLFDYTTPEFNRVFDKAFDNVYEVQSIECGVLGRENTEDKEAGASADITYRFQLDIEHDLAYILAHLAKHYRMGGTGIRSFLDLWVFLKRHRYDIDYPRLNRILDEMDFRNEAYSYLNLSMVLFGSKPSNRIYDSMIAYIFRAGAYGSVAMKVENDIRRSGRFIYFLRQLFPTVKDMKNTYPVLKKHLYLLPVCYIHRLTVGSIKGWGYTKRKLEGIFKRS